MDIEFADWLNDELSSRGWSSRELARRAEIAPQTVSAIITKSRGPGLEACVGIARAFHLPPEDVLRRAGLLPPLPPAVDNERALITLFRQLTGDTQHTVLTILSALAGRRPPDTIAESRTAYQTEPHTFPEYVAARLEHDLRALPLEDQQKIFDLMRQLRDQPPNGAPETT